ncbi:MAG: chromosomal replication initiator protein DnaA [Alphaproteobacteria bacterium]
MVGKGIESAQGGATPEQQIAWQKVREKLRQEYSDATFDSWLKPLALLKASAEGLLIAAPTRFMSDWVRTHYLARIADFWLEEAGDKVTADLIVDIDLAGSGEALPHAKPAPAASAGGHGGGPGPETYVGPLDPRFTFDSFVVGSSNDLAHAAARRVASSDAVQFNPLFLYGGVGLGKTHLMHAIAWHIKQVTPDRRVMYVSAETFMNQFIRALRFKDTMSFKDQFRSVDVLMIDDVQFIANKDATQEEFFHTFNALVDHNRQVIISADRSPSDLEGIEERIRSRLGWGLVADIHPTDYELRFGILQSKLEQMEDISVPADVLEFLARRITSNVRELEGALNRVAAYADLTGRAVTIDMTQEILQDLIRANDRRLSISEIQRHVAEYFNVRLAELLSARRAVSIARPRQVAMYLSKQLTSASLPQIGRKFGGRDHTTVIHAVKRIEELREIDGVLDEDIENLRRILEG